MEIMRTPKVTILIPSYRTPDLTKICLRLIRKNTPNGLAKVIVIDNDSRDASTEYLRSLAWITLTHADLAQTGATKEDLEGIVEYARRIRGVKVALLIRELHDGSTKVSLRSAGNADVAAIARELGGGGHPKAAGAVIAEPLQPAVSRVLELARAVLS